MKRLKIIMIWCAIALIFQNIIFIYIEKIYLNHNLTIKAVKVEKHGKAVLKNISLPSDAANLQASFDGRFISYNEKNSLKVADAVNDKVYEIAASKNMTIEYYKWLPDENLMLLAEKPVNSSQNQALSLYSYDAQRNSIRDLIDYNMNKIFINLSSQNERIDDIAFSTHTHINYIKLLNTITKKSSIYTINVQNQLEKIHLSSSIIGNIEMLPYDSILLYEDKINNKIKNFSNETNKDIIKNKNYTILGTDNNDNLYVGEKKSNQITKILYGDIKTPIDKWKSITLASPTNYENIIITLSGKIYVNDLLEGSLCDMETNKKTKYKGSFIDLCTSGIVSNLNGKYTITPIK